METFKERDTDVGLAVAKVVEPTDEELGVDPTCCTTQHEENVRNLDDMDGDNDD